jgi:hypothetical protein
MEMKGSTETNKIGINISRMAISVHVHALDMHYMSVMKHWNVDVAADITVTSSNIRSKSTHVARAASVTPFSTSS